MNHSPQRMWQLMQRGSDELADLLGLEAPPEVFTPERAFTALDAWLDDQEGPLDEDDTARLGFMLARVLMQTHGGGLLQIKTPGHALAGEWAVSGFEHGLARDYCVPFIISAARIGIERELGAQAWYARCLDEGR